MTTKPTLPDAATPLVGPDGRVSQAWYLVIQAIIVALKNSVFSNGINVTGGGISVVGNSKFYNDVEIDGVLTSLNGIAVTGDGHFLNAVKVDGVSHLLGGIDSGTGSAPIFLSGFFLAGGAVSTLATSVNGDVVFTSTGGTGGIRLMGQTAASLPASGIPAGTTRFVNNARNTGEAAGAGTGALATFSSAGVWRVNGSPVSA